MYKRPSSLPILFIATLLSGCGSDEGDAGFSGDPLVTVTSQSGELEIEVRTSPQPPQKGAAAVELRVHEAATGAPVEGLEIVVEPWMKAHGHGSNEITATELGAGTYEADGILFSMPGPWELRLHIDGPRSDAAETSSFQVLP